MTILSPAGGVQIFMGPGSTLVLPPYDYQDGVPSSTKVEVRRPFEEGREHLQKDEFEEAIRSFTEALNRAQESRNRVALFIQIGNALYSQRRYMEAHDAYANALREAEKAGDKEGKGSALAATANTYMMRTAADAAERAGNVREAVKLYSRALAIFNKIEFPFQHSVTQGDLGIAYAQLPAATPEEEVENFRKAIVSFEGALEICKRDENPIQYATMMTNLGEARRSLALVAAEKRNEALLGAIDCHKAALGIYKKDEYPVQFAGVQIRLGSIYINLSMLTPDERIENARKAIDSYDAALEVCAKDKFPIDFAMTQNGLGAAYAILSSATPEERVGNVNRAIAHYREALEIWKKDEYPQLFCNAAANLGTLLLEFGDPNACYWLKEAYSLCEYLFDQGKQLEPIIEAVCKDKPDG